MELIDKNKVVAKIEKRIKETESMRSMSDPFWEGQISAFDSVLKILDTIETKEVDLVKEIKRFTMSKELYEADSVIKAVAEHFFELGFLKAQKGE